MLSLFPQLLFLSPLGITLIRVAAAITLGYMAWSMHTREDTILRTRLPFIGIPAHWMLWVSSTVTALVALALLVGAGTQLAALIGAIIAIKHALGTRMYPALLPFPLSTYLLLACMCASLVVMGAGAVVLSVDLPL